MIRFLGDQAWPEIQRALQLRIGAAALELVVTWAGQQHLAQRQGNKDQPFIRALDQAEPMLIQELKDAVMVALPQFKGEPPVQVPWILGRVCRKCGCSDDDACEGGCSWASDDLCSRCVAAKAARK